MASIKSLLIGLRAGAKFMLDNGDITATLYHEFTAAFDRIETLSRSRRPRQTKATEDVAHGSHRQQMTKPARRR